MRVWRWWPRWIGCWVFPRHWMGPWDRSSPAAAGCPRGGLLLSMASAHMTGADFLVGMDHRHTRMTGHPPISRPDQHPTEPTTAIRTPRPVSYTHLRAHE